MKYKHASLDYSIIYGNIIENVLALKNTAPKSLPKLPDKILNIEDYSSITSLTVGGVLWQTGFAKSFSKSIEKFNNLTFLYIVPNTVPSAEILEDVIKVIIQGVKEHSHLNHIYFGSAKCDDDFLFPLTSVFEELKDNKTLKTISIDNCLIDEKNIEVVANFLKDNKTLASLDLNFKSPLNETKDILSQALEHNYHITKGSYSLNQIMPKIFDRNKLIADKVIGWVQQGAVESKAWQLIDSFTLDDINALLVDDIPLESKDFIERYIGISEKHTVTKIVDSCEVDNILTIGDSVTEYTLD